MGIRCAGSKRRPQGHFRFTTGDGVNDEQEEQRLSDMKVQHHTRLPKNIHKRASDSAEKIRL